MALSKQKAYCWNDSNLAMFGSDTEIQVKKESAATEPAWQTAGQKPGLQIWRIVNFKVTTWPEADYGNFYDGDSYIILNTYKMPHSNHLLYDVHFWIGQYSTQDEYATAAYKTVELDTFLDDMPVQHREVQGHESGLFRSYFKAITTLKGGADSGFRKVKPEEYTPRLLHFHGDRTGVLVKEIPRCKSLMDNTDVYILDLGLKLVQWNGTGANKDEKMKALYYIRELQGQRGGKCRTECIDENPNSAEDEFYDYLDELDETGSDYEDDEQEVADTDKELWRLSDASGNMMMNLERKGSDVCKKALDSKDVFILDTKLSVFVWIGNETSFNEKLNALSYAHNYLMKTDHPFVPITCVSETMNDQRFNTAITA